MITLYDLEKNEKAITNFTESSITTIKSEIKSSIIQHVFQDKMIWVTIENMLSYYIKVAQSEKNIDFARGRLAGIAELYNYIINMSEAARNTSKSLEDVYLTIKTVRHGDDILERLSTEKGIMHKDLSKLINVDPSTLTGIMERLENLELTRYTKIGKFKFYYVSEFGQKYKDDKLRNPYIQIESLKNMLEKEKGWRPKIDPFSYFQSLKSIHIKSLNDCALIAYNVGKKKNNQSNKIYAQELNSSACMYNQRVKS